MNGAIGFQQSAIAPGFEAFGSLFYLPTFDWMRHI